MKRTLLTLALVMATGAAAAQNIPPPLVGGGNSGVTAANGMSPGAAVAPGGGARLDTSVRLHRARTAAAIDPMDIPAQALTSDVNIATAPAPRLGAANPALRHIEHIE